MKSCSTQIPCSLQGREQLPQFGKVSNAEQIEMMACQWQIYSDGEAGWQGSPSLREVIGLQGNHKLTGSLNVTLSFPPSCLGIDLKMLLIWHLRLKETGTRAPWFMFWPPYSPCDNPVSSASVHFPLQVGGCRLTQLSRPCQCQQSVYKPTPLSRLTQHVPS